MCAEEGREPYKSVGTLGDEVIEGLSDAVLYMQGDLAESEYRKHTFHSHNRPDSLDVCTDPFYSQANMERLKKAARELEAGNGTAHEIADD